MPFTKEELLATLDPVTFDDAFDVLLELGRRETPAFNLSPDEIQAYRKALAWLLASPSCTNPFGGLYVWGPTVITSNYPPDVLSGPNLYDDRTASRIQGDCVIVHLSSTDHRLASAQPRS